MHAVDLCTFKIEHCCNTADKYRQIPSVSLITIIVHIQYLMRGLFGSVTVEHLLTITRVRILAGPLQVTALGKLLTRMCLCHQAV